MFLGKYKLILGTDCKRIYKSKYYYWKRLKILEKGRYIKRVDRVYIKLDNKGTRLVKKFGYDYSFSCRSNEYMERVKQIAMIAGLTIDSNIDFIASWNMKDNMQFTQISRKFLGKLKYQGKATLIYYISKDKEISYISQIINDIRKTIDYENIIIFLENMKMLNENQKFIFAKESTVIIKPTARNLLIMRRLEEIDFYQIIKQIYKNTEILLSNWENAEYMTEDNEYIVLMPFIDTEKLYRLNIFYRNIKNVKRKINVMTLQENKEKINEILTNKANIIEIDDWLGGTDERE